MALSNPSPYLQMHAAAAGVSSGPGGGLLSGAVDDFNRGARSLIEGPGGIGAGPLRFAEQQTGLGMSKAQLAALKQQTNQRQRLFDQLLPMLSRFGTGAGGTSAGGIDSSLLDQINASGDTQRARINEQFNAAQGTNLAQLQQRGFAGSNLLTAGSGAIEDKRAFSQGDLEKNLLDTRIGVQERGADRAIQMQSLLAQLLSGAV